MGLRIVFTNLQLLLIIVLNPQRSKKLRRYAVQKSKCLCWCRLRGSASFISPLKWTEDGLKFRLPELSCNRAFAFRYESHAVSHCLLMEYGLRISSLLQEFRLDCGSRPWRADRHPERPRCLSHC